MGSGESTTRKVSFGVDDEERVRILRGVKLSEDVLQRMRGVANMPPPRAPPSTSSQTDIGTSFSANSSNRSQQNSQQRAQSSTQSKTSKTTAKVKEAQRKSEHQQSILREMETGKEEMIKAMSRERKQTRQEAEKAKQLVQELQKKELQLKALDAFYKEQVALLEKRNMEMYEQSKEQFHQAASKTESHVRSRNTDPVCSGLQSQILACYKENGQQTLRCSELAKEYMRCINTAKRNNLVNHG
ncbi:MICOS complex subunit mic25a-like isoform X1 [Dunckerocampus dactyliophorus]|uniref:MICOS complex subunit mic25a-like isoform X1 n=1 Tax=Dunckerocampus dactyliophorus TaxID=161453 RepID=UPI002407611C|nr:MICOS complex subunit mic25a-like isoform X1 [Dunckerocampus dactyliophorus]